MTDLYAKYTRLKFERPAERVLQIVLDTPGRLNATDARMHGELAQVWRDLDADPEVSVALIRGAGKAFSAGGDLALVEAIADDFATRTRVWREARELPAAHVRRRRRVEAILAALLDLAADKGIVVFYETAQLFQGWARARCGATDDGIAQMREALARLASTEQQVEYPYLVSILAETFLQAGRQSEARDRLEEALRQVEATEERWYEAELHRLAGELALAEGDAAGAEARFRCAVSVATAQSARLWTLRAAMGLARPWRDAGQPRAAHAMLAPLLADFTEGFGTPDLKDAKALLDELA